MARTSTLCDRIISEVSKRNVRLCVCHNRLFNPAVREAKASGDYKLVKTVNKTYVTSHWSQKPEEGGMLWENGTHYAYIQNYFLGKVEEVFAVGDKMGNPTYYKIFSLLKSAYGVIGVMELSWVSNHNEDMLELYKFDGSVKIDISYFPKRFFDIYSYDNSVSQILKEAIKALYSRATSMLSAITPRSFHFELIKSYIDSLKNDGEPPVKPTEGRAAIRLLECIEKSIETGKWVHFNASQ
jgi:predicted dehydrogenase